MIVLMLVNSVDPDETQYYALFYLCLLYLPKYQLRGFPVYKDLEHEFIRRNGSVLRMNTFFKNEYILFMKLINIRKSTL